MKALLVAGLPVLGVLAMPVLFIGVDDASGGGLQHPDIPAVALQAYVDAAEAAAEAEPPCAISWSLLAAIGKVESDHGRHGSSQLDPAGRATPPIIGIPLDGTNNTAAIRDTDGGQLDGDPVWDRAVGPMQFIPSTWSRWGRDGDGDDRADPQDIHDVARSAAAYLCHSSLDLTDPLAARAAVLSYNRSSAYVDEVLAIAATYLAEATHLTDTLFPGSGPIGCPVVAPVTFIDSWHFPRPGGRVHLGQDMFAAEGQPLVALADGTIEEVRSGAGLGGNIIWLRTDDGHAWYYAHLSAFARSAVPGREVERGEVIGFVGRTGNAVDTPPHLHIQWRPAGRHGTDTNPYALLDAACPGH